MLESTKEKETLDLMAFAWKRIVARHEIDKNKSHRIQRPGGNMGLDNAVSTSTRKEKKKNAHSIYIYIWALLGLNQ